MRYTTEYVIKNTKCPPAYKIISSLDIYEWLPVWATGTKYGGINSVADLYKYPEMLDEWHLGYISKQSKNDYVIQLPDGPYHCNSYKEAFNTISSQIQFDIWLYKCWREIPKESITIDMMCDVLHELDKALDGYDGIECDYRQTQNVISVHDVGDETHPLKQWYCYVDCNPAYVAIGKKYNLIPIRHYRGDALGGPVEVAFVTSEVYDEWSDIMKSFALPELNNQSKS